MMLPIEAIEGIMRIYSLEYSVFKLSHTMMEIQVKNIFNLAPHLVFHQFIKLRKERNVPLHYAFNPNYALNFVFLSL